jgi:hypothetical protein
MTICRLIIEAFSLIERRYIYYFNHKIGIQLFIKKIKRGIKNAHINNQPFFFKCFKKPKEK